MEHIKNILVRRQSALLEQRQLSLFGSHASEKGRGEWSAFNAVRGDRTDAYRVATPLKPQPRYANIVPIRRYRTA